MLSEFTLKTLLWVREDFSPFLAEELTQIIYKQTISSNTTIQI